MDRGFIKNIWRKNALIWQTLWRVMAIGLVVQIGMLWLDYGQVRWDLTSEKRFTLSAYSREVLMALEGPLQVAIYLSGDLPAGFQRLQQETLAQLRAMQAYADIRLRVMPPSTAQGTAQKQYFMALSAKGIQPTSLRYQQQGRQSQQWIFPGLLLQYGTREQSVMLLQGKAQATPEESLNSSIESLEYNIMRGIAQLTSPNTHQIGVVGNLATPSFQSTKQALGHAYDLRLVEIDRPIAVDQFPVLLVFPKQRPYVEVEKYNLDQYLMRGGRALFFTNGVQVSMDSLSERGHLALPYDTGLEDLLFNYGVRVKKELIEDLYCASYPVVTGQFGTRPQIALLPWPFFVNSVPSGAHAVVRNLDHILLRFCSPIDTVYASGVEKTPLLYSSTHTRNGVYPRQIGLNLMQEMQSSGQLLAEDFPLSTQVLGYLLEGNFSSRYVNRLLPAGTKGAFVPSGRTQIMVIGTSHFLHSDLNPQTKQLSPLGMYWPEGKRYGNAAFLEQALAYCLDPNGLILSRNKRVVLRPLDKTKIQQAYWKWVNLGVPLFCWVLVAGIAYWIRTNSYAKPYNKGQDAH